MGISLNCLTCVEASSPNIIFSTTLFPSLLLYLGEIRYGVVAIREKHRRLIYSFIFFESGYIGFNNGKSSILTLEQTNRYLSNVSCS